MNIELEKIEIEALIQLINATAIRGSDARLIARLLDKLEESEAVKQEYIMSRLRETEQQEKGSQIEPNEPQNTGGKKAKRKVKRKSK